MAIQLGGGGGVKSDINVTPLVDVMLVLLIIMMIVAPLLQQGVSLNLPIAFNSTDKPETQGQTVVAIDAQKRFYVGVKQVTKDESDRRGPERSLDTKKEKTVIIKADRAVEYGAVMEAMDQLRMGGDRGHGSDHRHPGTEEERVVRWPLISISERIASSRPSIPQGQRGHEHHADDRRAARAPRHLHGGAAHLAERARRQPAGGNAAVAADAGAQPDRARVHQRSGDVDQQAAGQPRRTCRSVCRKSSTSAKRRRSSSSATACCRTADIIYVIDSAKGAGVEKVGIVTEGMRKAAQGGAE